jgi:hypothetical protein
MKAKLIKTDKGNYILVDSTKGVYDKGYLIGSSRESDVNKLSKQNCEAIANGYDVYELAKENYHKFWPIIDESGLINHTFGYVAGFNKAMELNKDKVFTLEQMSVAYNTNRSGTLFEQLINSFGGQPTEIEVEIEMELNMNGKNAIDRSIYIPKLDSEGCLILKKI